MQVQQDHSPSIYIGKNFIHNIKYNLKPRNNSMIIFKIRLEEIELTKNGRES